MPRRHDDDDDRDEPVTPKQPILPRVIAAVGLVPWSLLALVVVGVVVLWALAMGKATSAVQEASLSAGAAAVLVAAYALARCGEKVVEGCGKLFARG